MFEMRAHRGREVGEVVDWVQTLHESLDFSEPKESGQIIIFHQPRFP